MVSKADRLVCLFTAKLRGEGEETTEAFLPINEHFPLNNDFILHYRTCTTEKKRERIRISEGNMYSFFFF